MTFISYAQNFEDVLLWRALKGVDDGFYIDVGANDPVVDSVTNAFYERGWHGINVEPVSEDYLALQKARPRDINLHCALGAESADRDMWHCDVRGWGTLDVEVAKLHERDGYFGAWHKTPVKTLKELCLKFSPSQIHFLKVDVEGYEAEVLKGMDFTAYRPWIVIVEAVAPGMRQDPYIVADQILKAAGYLKVYTDGLNSFYVAQEQQKLLESFKYPPNVFDDFVRHSEHASNENLKRLKIELETAERSRTLVKKTLSEALSQAKKANSRADLLEQRAKRLEHELAALYGSRSWKLTAPIRSGVDMCRHLKKEQVLDAAKRTLRKCARVAVSFALANPRVKQMASKMLARTPRLKHWLQRIALSGSSLEAGRQFNPHNGELSPRAERLYVALKDALKSRDGQVK